MRGARESEVEAIRWTNREANRIAGPEERGGRIGREEYETTTAD
jgi:hypothetical protein